MNSKGFAITGILYTLFVLFMMILVSILSTISYKKGVLEKTILGLEDDFSLIDVSDLDSTYQINDQNITIKVSGKYVFKLITKVNNNDVVNECSVYLKKGENIPISIEANNTDSSFTLIPNDCNEYEADVVMNNPTSVELNKLILTNVYKFKDSD